MTPPPRVLIDACVLYPTVLRDIVLGVAKAGAFIPFWSPRILAEWQHAAARLGAEAAAFAGGEVALLRAHWPGAEVAHDPALEQELHLPDPADCHVLAAAIAAHADVICTRNLRDFPARALAPHGIRAMSPDDLLMAAWLADDTAVTQTVAQVQDETARISGRPQPLRPLLRRAGLPRLGKALSE